MQASKTTTDGAASRNTCSTLHTQHEEGHSSERQIFQPEFIFRKIPFSFASWTSYIPCIQRRCFDLGSLANFKRGHDSKRQRHRPYQTDQSAKMTLYYSLVCPYFYLLPSLSTGEVASSTGRARGSWLTNSPPGLHAACSRDGALHATYRSSTLQCATKDVHFHVRDHVLPSMLIPYSLSLTEARVRSLPSYSMG